MKKWSDCKNILCIRADNMGDVIMSIPAFKALKESFGCNITLLTSARGNVITPHVPVINDVIVCDVPWIKTNISTDVNAFKKLIGEIKQKHFDAAIIFTVYSQSALPAAMLCYMAGIPLRLAYCRENPYDLLTDWLPDAEPYSFIRHQVERDLELVKSIGATTNDDSLQLKYNKNAITSAYQKLEKAGVGPGKKWLILHPCVSEKKREYPKHLWSEVGKLLIKQTNYQLLITGVQSENCLTKEIAEAIGIEAHSIAGLLNIEEFIALVDASPLVISVNTGTVHIAAALQTPVIVLYALTNPQHTPWKAANKVFYFNNIAEEQSRNEVVKYVREKLQQQTINYPQPQQVVDAAVASLEQNAQVVMEEDCFV